MQCLPSLSKAEQNAQKDTSILLVFGMDLVGPLSGVSVDEGYEGNGANALAFDVLYPKVM